MDEPERGVNLGSWGWMGYLLAFLGSAAAIGLGAFPAVGLDATAGVTIGAIGLALVLTLLPIHRTLRRIERSSARDTELIDAIRSLEQQAALSSDARRVLNRKRERELLIGAIDEDLNAGDYDAASVLVKELADRFGYREDAERFRQKIGEVRCETHDRRIAEAIENIDRLIIERQWDAAIALAGKTRRLYPDSTHVEGLQERVEQARQLCKSDLERGFLNAANEGRYEDAMAALKQLDGYLTSREAAPLQEVARGVIGKARENLGARFKLALQDRRWDQAEDLGKRIIEHFPNTRLAAEARELMDTIRQRAAELAAARGR